MPKYTAVLVQREIRTVEFEAKNDEQALAQAADHWDDDPFGDVEFEFDIYDLEELNT